MPTTLSLRTTQTNGIGAGYYDMGVVAGDAETTAVVSTVASGTEIQWTDAEGGAVIQWVSGRVPAGGFTLTSTDLSVWCHQSHMNANCGGRYRVFRRAADGTETELGGGPFSDGVEFSTGATEMTWAGNVTDTSFAENDRILLKIYITNVGTMGGNFNCTLTYNAAAGATGDSFFRIAETVAFKGDSTTTNQALSAAATGLATLARLSAFALPMSALATGTAALTAAQMYLQSLVAAVTGTASILTRMATGVALAATATAVATVTGITQYLRALGAGAAGSASVGRVLSVLIALPVTALGSAGLTRIASLYRALGASGTITGVVSVASAFRRTLEASATGSAALIAGMLLVQTLTSAVHGIAGLAYEFVEYVAGQAGAATAAARRIMRAIRHTHRR